MRPIPNLSRHGLNAPGTIYANLSATALIEEAVCRREAQLTAEGALVAFTGKRTGRSPGDKFIVKEAATQDLINWGKVNQPLAPEVFSRLLNAAWTHLEGKDVFVQDSLALRG